MQSDDSLFAANRRDPEGWSESLQAWICVAVEVGKGEQVTITKEALKFKRMAQKMAALTDAALRAIGGDYVRAGGDAECLECLLPYIDHPDILGLTTFHLICNGQIVKL